jgi:hypothetical protein
MIHFIVQSVRYPFDEDDGREDDIFDGIDLAVDYAREIKPSLIYITLDGEPIGDPYLVE